MAPQRGREAANFVFNRMVQQGIHPTYAAAAVGHLVEETGWFAPDVIAGKRRGDQGTAAYLAQWRGPRLRNLENFARQQGRPIDLATQVDFLIHEGKANLDHGAARWYQEATSGRGNLQDAVASFAHFERPAGYNERNPRGIKTFNKRLQHANAVSQLVGSAGPGVGAEMPSYLQGVAGVPGQPTVPRGGNVRSGDLFSSIASGQGGNVGGLSNTGNYTAPSLAIDYGEYGIETPDLSGPLTPQTLYNGMPYVSAFANDPYLEGRA